MDLAEDSGEREADPRRDEFPERDVLQYATETSKRLGPSYIGTPPQQQPGPT